MEELTEKEKEICAYITKSIFNLADSKGEDRNVYYFKILNRLADFGCTHDLDNMKVGD